MPDHRSRHQGGSCDHQPPPGGRHTDEHGQGAEGEQTQASALRTFLGLVGTGFQQRCREVLAPDEDGMGQRPQQHQVHHQPRRLGHHAVSSRDDHGTQQPDDDGVVAGAIATSAAGPSCSRPGRASGALGTGGDAHARTAE